MNELTEGIQKKQEDIQTKLSNLGKILNKDITDVSQVNAYDGIVFRAPIRGRITELTVEEGEKVENFNIATIVDDSRVKISFKVNTYEYDSLKEGQKYCSSTERLRNTGPSLPSTVFIPEP